MLLCRNISVVAPIVLKLGSISSKPAVPALLRKRPFWKCDSGEPGSDSTLHAVRSRLIPSQTIHSINMTCSKKYKQI